MGIDRRVKRARRKAATANLIREMRIGNEDRAFLEHLGKTAKTLQLQHAKQNIHLDFATACSMAHGYLTAKTQLEWTGKGPGTCSDCGEASSRLYDGHGKDTGGGVVDAKDLCPKCAKSIEEMAGAAPPAPSVDVTPTQEVVS